MTRPTIILQEEKIILDNCIVCGCPKLLGMTGLPFCPNEHRDRLGVTQPRSGKSILSSQSKKTVSQLKAWGWYHTIWGKK